MLYQLGCREPITKCGSLVERGSKLSHTGRKKTIRLRKVVGRIRGVGRKTEKSEVPGRAERSDKELSYQHLGHTLVSSGPSNDL